MTDARSVGVATTADLATLNAILAQEEARLGPLLSVGHGPLYNADGTVTTTQVTVLTFDMDQNPPAHTTELALIVGTNLPQQPGATLIGTGSCYVAGQLLNVAAFRQN